MRRRTSPVLAVLALLLVVAPLGGASPAGAALDPTPATPPPPTAAPAADGLQVGVQFHGTWDVYEATPSDRETVTEKLADMGAQWVRIDISWAMLEPREGERDTARIDAAIQAAHAQGLNVLGTFWLTPRWANGSTDDRKPPKNPKKYAKALAWAADHWRNEVQAWEVWNEPDSTDFFRGANPKRYAELLCAARAAVPAGSTTLVFGGTVYNHLSWIKQTYPEAKRCFDAMATHPYMAPSDLSPRETSTKPIWDFRGIARVHDWMVGQGDTRPIWLTEFGWSTHDNPPHPDNSAIGVSEQEQADFTVDALAYLRSDFPYVKRAFIYQERDLGGDVHQQGYGILVKQGDTFVPRLVYTALMDYLT